MFTLFLRYIIHYPIELKEINNQIPFFLFLNFKNRLKSKRFKSSFHISNLNLVTVILLRKNSINQKQLNKTIIRITIVKHPYFKYFNKN